MSETPTRKKVLIITYYWPPMGGGGVQRWLKMTKYLRGFGWEPIIFTVQNGEGSVEDTSLSAQIPENIETHRVKIWEPFELYKKFTGKGKNEKLSPGLVSAKKSCWTQKLSVWIRGNVFIPDARRFWIRPASKYLDNYLKEHHVDAIVSTGPPHSTHLIALKQKKRHSIPWLADFRDPWTNIDFYDRLMLTKWADRKHHELEYQVLKNADQVVTVSKSWADDFEKLGGTKPVVITNGYDPEDFMTANSILDEKFTITHAGSLNSDRNPTTLWKILGEMVKNHPAFAQDLQVQLIGQISASTIDDLTKFGLRDNLRLIDQLAHSEVIQKLKSSQVLLLLLNQTPNVSGIIPGKLFEYIGAKRPILCLGTETGDAAQIIRETRSGKVLRFDDSHSLEVTLRRFHQHFQQNDLEVESSDFEKFSRKVLAGKMTRELDELSAKNS